MQKYQKTEIHVSVTDITTQKLPEAECESKLQQSEAINNLKATIDDLTKTVKANNGTVRMTSNYFTKILKAINRKERWLNEDKKQFQATIDDLTRTVESLNQTIQMLCGKPNDVSTCKVEVVTNSKWTEILPAVNTVYVSTNSVVSHTYSASIIRVCVRIFLSRFCALCSTPISYRSAQNCKCSLYCNFSLVCV